MTISTISKSQWLTHKSYMNNIVTYFWLSKVVLFWFNLEKYQYFQFILWWKSFINDVNLVLCRYTSQYIYSYESCLIVVKVLRVWVKEEPIDIARFYATLSYILHFNHVKMIKCCSCQLNISIMCLLVKD